ncbi:MAG: protein kinase [Bacillota bacterium]
MDIRSYTKYIKDLDINIDDCEFLGEGHNGIVYRLPEDKVIKICFTEVRCLKEYSILRRVNNSEYFPRVYGMSRNYMIRDYVNGVNLKDYIRDHGMSKDLAIRIMDLIEEFKKLKFLKEDVRCKDIFVQPNGSLMVIDPKRFYTKKRDFPRHLSKGLYKLGVLETFLSFVKEERPSLYAQWHKSIDAYITQKKKEYLAQSNHQKHFG